MGYYDWDAQLDRLRLLQDDWDSYGAPAPSHESIARAEHVLTKLLIPKGWIPRRIVPAGEGGTAITYRGGPDDINYGDICFLNDGSREVWAHWVNGGVTADFHREWQQHSSSDHESLDDIEQDVRKVLFLIKSDVLLTPIDAAGRQAWRETLER